VFGAVQKKIPLLIVFDCTTDVRRRRLRRARHGHRCTYGAATCDVGFFSSILAFLKKFPEMNRLIFFPNLTFLSRV
jgi:hypothetical protein